ncbi:MAG: TRAP transporter TatT component family protein [Spirochaetales bacterium]|nr:TRAP transporter TatT component family protein [Spirochaetales bacterium]
MGGNMIKIAKISVCLSLLVLCFSCSINRLAVSVVADMLSGEESTVFTGDNDPQLIGDALPFALKLYESLLEADPDNTELLLSTGKAFCLYAFAYVVSPAEMLPDDEYEKKEAALLRAKKLYLRGRHHLMHALSILNKDFYAAFSEDNHEKALSCIKGKHLPWLYWAGAAWLGAVTTDPFDVELMIDYPVAVGFILKVVEMDESYDNGSPHELLISYYGGIPAEMGGSEEKARFHYEQALRYSEGLKAGPHLALATSVCVTRQYPREFRELLNKVLSIDVSEETENRLLNILAQQKAEWLLEHIEDFFILDDTGEEGF